MTRYRSEEASQEQVHYLIIIINIIKRELTTNCQVFVKVKAIPQACLPSCPYTPHILSSCFLHLESPPKERGLPMEEQRAAKEVMQSATVMQQ